MNYFVHSHSTVFFMLLVYEVIIITLLLSIDQRYKNVKQQLCKGRLFNVPFDQFNVPLLN